MAYIRVVGMEIDTDGSNRMGKTFTEEEEEEYIQMSRRPNLYNEFCRSIAPGKDLDDRMTLISINYFR